MIRGCGRVIGSMELDGVAYSLFLPQHETADLVALEGQPLRALTGWGNHQSNFARYRVGEGDTVVAIYLEAGRVMLLARMVVRFKGRVREWNERNADAAINAAAESQVLVARAASEIVFGRPVPRELLARWVFASVPQKRLLVDRDGAVRSSVAVEGMRRLTEETAERLCALDGMALRDV